MLSPKHILVRFFLPPHFSFPNVSFVSASQFEEKFEEMNNVEPPPKLPFASSTGSNVNTVGKKLYTASKNEETTECQDQPYQTSCANTSNELVGGIMKIVPSDVDVSFVLITWGLIDLYLSPFWFIIWQVPHVLKCVILPWIQNDADYWLLSDADVSITDMWRTDCILLGMLAHPLPKFSVHFQVVISCLFHVI